MTLVANTFEGGSDGTSISTSNSGGASGDAFSVISSTAPVFDAAAAVHGSLGMKAQTAGSTQCYARYSSFASTQLSFRLYYRYSTHASSTQIMQILTGASAAAFVVQNADGSISLTDQAAVARVTTPALTDATTYRIECQIKTGSSNTGSVAMQVYAGDSTTALSSGSNAAVNTRTGNITAILLGKISGSDTVAFRFDDLIFVDGVLTALGPSQFTDAGTGSTALAATGSSTTTRSASRTAGTMLTSSATEATVRVTAATAAVHVAASTPSETPTRTASGTAATGLAAVGVSHTLRTLASPAQAVLLTTSATSATVRTAADSESVTVTATGTGHVFIARDITLTYTVGTGRWATSTGTGRWTTTPTGHDRWQTTTGAA